MAETQLNLNAPLMSVRRFASPIRDNAKLMLRPHPHPQPDFASDAAAVPFHWEHIPGQAKHPHHHRPSEEEDAYSDALDTLSSNGSVSFDCSATSLSGSAALVQPCGTFSTDPHTRDFMMKRFLPAAKAMAFEPPPPNYSSKKPQDQPRHLSPRVVRDDSRPVPHLMAHNQHGVHQNGDDNEDSEDSDVDVDVEYFNEPKIISTSGCGLLPRLCFRNSLNLIDPLPGLKLASPKPIPTVYKQSLSKSVKKAWDNYKKKSEGGSLPTQVKKMVEDRKPNESKWRTFSGELKGRLSPFRNSRSSDVDSTPRPKKLEMRSRSGELGVVESKKFTYSGELYRGRLSPFRNTRSAEMAEKKQQQLTYSGDLQRVAPLPLRNGNASISPYRNQTSESPFRRSAFVSVPKVDYANSRPNLLSNKGRASINPTSIAVEKTVYADTVGKADSRYSRWGGNLGNKPRFYSGEQFVRPVRVDEASQGFSFQCVDNALALEILEQEILMSVDDDVKPSSMVCTAKRVLNKVDGKEDSPLTPPLPRSPSESWLWRTIPVRSSKSQNLEPNKGCSTKWETIVKTSKMHHDHARYSEELVAHISVQSKT